MSTAGVAISARIKRAISSRRRTTLSGVDLRFSVCIFQFAFLRPARLRDCRLSLRESTSFRGAKGDNSRPGLAERSAQHGEAFGDRRFRIFVSFELERD